LTALWTLPSTQRTRADALASFLHHFVRLLARHYSEAFRHASKGAWPFSTPDQSYTVSDTTSEAMKAVMGIQDLASVSSPSANAVLPNQGEADLLSPSLSPLTAVVDCAAGSLRRSPPVA
jgi:squalene cyclase